jgi:hypothetical protein
MSPHRRPIRGDHLETGWRRSRRGRSTTATSSSRLAASPQKPPFPRNAVDLQQSGLLRGRRFAQEWSEVVRMAQSWPKFEARSWGPCAKTSRTRCDNSGRWYQMWSTAPVPIEVDPRPLLRALPAAVASAPNRPEFAPASSRLAPSAILKGPQEREPGVGLVARPPPGHDRGVRPGDHGPSAARVLVEADP